MDKGYKYIDNPDLRWSRLDKIEINFIEMRIQCRRIEDIGNELSAKLDSLISAVTALADLLDGVSVGDFSGCKEKINSSINLVVEKMTEQTDSYKKLNDEIKRELEMKVNQLFEYVEIDANGNRIYDSIYNFVDKKTNEKVNYNELREQGIKMAEDKETSMNDDINYTNLSGKTSLEQNEILISELNYNNSTRKIVNLDGYNAPIIIDDIINTNPGEIDAYLYGKAIEIGMTPEQAKMSIAISRYETGDYSSNRIVNDNNWGGIKIGSSSLSEGIMTDGDNFVRYSSTEQGAVDFLSAVKRCFDKGCTSFADIQKTYCNDTDVNGYSHWLNTVTGVYNDRFVDYDRVMER